jgi:MazG family protein
MNDRLKQTNEGNQLLVNRFARVAAIWEIIDQLRGEPGCPWDRKQTPESVQTYLVEEAHEAAAAVRAGEILEAGEELGDLLFMVLFLIHLYEENGNFSLEDVCQSISDKMIRRHPHVFGDVVVQSTQDVRDNWEKIKAGESSAKGKETSLNDVPRSLPALMRAYRMLSRLAQEDPSWNHAAEQSGQLSILVAHLIQWLQEGNQASAAAYGRLLLALVNLARLDGHRAEDCLQQALQALVDVQASGPGE